MNLERIEQLLELFPGKRVLVVGDLYLDENVYGKVTGVSLEAPIPILEVAQRRYNPGAAGNAACNIAALGIKTGIVGVVGEDANAAILRHEFETRNVDTTGIVVDAASPTNTYGKMRAGGYNTPDQEVLRTDTPTPAFISGAVEDKVILNIESRAPEVDAIVVTDQVASVATARVLNTVVALAKKHNIPAIGDSRSRIGAFQGFDVVTPNDREAGIGVDIEVVDETSLMAAGSALLNVVSNALVTRGPGGITVFAPGEDPFTVPTMATRIVDVTGGGDTVTAAVTASLVAGGDLREAAWLGNAAAAVAVAKHGVVTVTPEELTAFIRAGGEETKVRTLDELKTIVPELQRQGRRVIWTNGCFDILHAGHVTYLQSAAREGDVLVVGLNSDASVSAVKGPERPIVPEDERALIIAALECTAYVTVFDEPSPAPILTALKPDVYTKGGDYTIDTINQEERGIVEAYGGRIALIPGVDGRSTTNLVSRLSREYAE